jgi:23S rRNA pseudouridine1911/1915/1917 synthase
MEEKEIMMTIPVEENLEERLDKYLINELDESRTTIAKLIDNEFILVNDKKTSAHYKCRKGDIITVFDGYNEDIEITPENIPIDIVYEDDDIIIVNKASGLVVHPGNGNQTGTLVNALMYHTNNLSDINGEVRPGIVHRIDKDTSGLMVVAKNNKAHQILSDMLSRHEIKRDYIAIVKGEFTSDTATIDAPIGRDKINRKKMAVTADNSKDAITHVKVLKKYKGYTLVKCSLETGRTHQIRVHMAYIGFPIVNDPVYTNDTCTSFGQYLHSTSIDFNHPITGEHLHFEVEPPKEFEEFLSKLEEI